MQPTNSESNPKSSFQDNPVRAVGVRLRAHKCVLNVWPRVEFPNLATSIDLSHMSFGCLYLLVFVCVALSLSLSLCLSVCPSVRPSVCLSVCLFVWCVCVCVAVSLMIPTSAHDVP